MSAESSRAVFLSYASQDAEAAQRICDALRAAGVEVWFDQNELTGGDVWDQKIRGQIKSCALFVPIISAATNARREGYFRREWKIAVDRTHDMDEALPFLVPVVIDGTTDAGAFVPEKFREVQWTRLIGGETPEKFCARVKALLGGQADRNGSVVGARLVRAQEDGRGRATPRQKSSRPWLWAVIAVAVLVAAAVVAWPPWRKPDRPAPNGAALVAVAGPSEAAKLAEQARGHYQGIFTRADLALAEELGRQAAEREPTLARAWAVRAAAQACYLMRGFVAGETAQQHAREAESFANRALALDREEPEALIALGQLTMFQHAPAQAEAFFRRVLVRAPNNPFARRYLSIVLRTSNRVPEAIAVMEDAVRRNPGDVLTHFDLAIAYAYGWDWPKAWAEADAALAIQPFPGAQMLKVRLAFQWKGDVALMRTLLDQVDVTYRGEDDAVLWDMKCGLFERRPDRVLEAAGRTARIYLEESFIFPGPKAWFTAQAYQLAGKDALARQQWQAAESVLRERLQADPQNLDLRLERAVTLAWLKRTDEAKQELSAIESAWREQLNPDRAWDLASFYAASGDARTAVPLLRMALHAGTGIAPLTINHLRLDPWWDPIRGAPEFQALLTNPPPMPAPVTAPAAVQAGAPDEKSVAVLAFADLSAAHDSEYFSDGISEELINALGKVPGLKVPARTSSFYFKGKNVPVPDIAKQLGVAYVIEGSVQRAGDKVKISARLSKAADGFQVWSDSFTRDAKDVFAVEDEIAGLIAKNLSLKLGASSAATTAAVKPEAFALYVQGRQLWNRRTEEDYVQAERMFNRALELEPNFARAYVGRADARVFLAARRGEVGTWGQRNARLLADIAADIQRALELDADLAEAHASMGILHSLRAERDAAVQEYLTAIRLNPNYATAHQWLALEYWRQGRLAEARTAALAGVKADPFSSVVAAACSIVLQSTGDFSVAMAQAERALTLQPDSLRALGAKVSILFDLGRRDEALALARSIVGRDATTQGLGRALLVLGAAGEAGEVERARHVSGPLASLLELQGAAALGKWDEFFARWNSSCLTLDDVWYLYVPALDPIRADTRFLGLLKEAGMLEAHTRFQAWRQTHPPEKPEAKQ